MEDSGIVWFAVTAAGERLLTSELRHSVPGGIRSNAGHGRDHGRRGAWLWRNQDAPTAKVGHRRVINLHKIRRDLDRGKSVFYPGWCDDE